MGNNSESLQRSIAGKSEIEVIHHVARVLNNYYGDGPIISRFLSSLQESREEVFFYLEDSNVEKTMGTAEHHFSVMAVVAQIQGEGRSTEDVFLAPLLTISKNLLIFCF